MSETTPSPAAAPAPVHHVKTAPARSAAFDDPYAKRLFLIIDSLPQM